MSKTEGENIMDKIDYKTLLPKGIRFRGNNALQVQSNKTTWVDGKKQQLREFTSVPIKTNEFSTYADAFKSALQEAMKVKMRQDTFVSSSGYGRQRQRRFFGVWTIKQGFDALFEKQWAGKKQEKNIKIYAQDIFNYFPVDTRLDDMQTEENYDGFIKFVAKQIEERPKNNLSSVSNKSINHRLMVIREICRYAIKQGMLDQSKLLNPDARKKDMGWENLPEAPSKRKRPLTEEEIQAVYDQATFEGQTEFADAFLWLVDTGMRHQTEFHKFVVGNIDYKNGTICFYREKTDTWSVNIPLTPRLLEIAKARKELAFKRGGKNGKLFEISNNKCRALFDRYKKKCGLPELFTPYATRHTFITRLVEAGNPANVVMDLAGHKCIETTLGFYAQSTNKSLNNAINSISKKSSNDEGNNNSSVSMIGHNWLKAKQK